MARRFVGRSRGGARRSTTWISIPFFIDSEVAAGGAIVASLGADALAMRPFTIVRTRMDFQVISDQIAADEVQVGAIAMAVVSDQASAVGVTAVPTPVTDVDSDLFYAYQAFFSDLTFGSGIGFANTGTRWTLESKAMRKVNDDQDVILVHELSTVGSGWTLMAGGRFLVKNH